jgi:hypothetical protein
MFSIRVLLCVPLLLSAMHVLAWGPIGHYVIGDIAEKHMKPQTIGKIEAILQMRSISGVGVWMDNIRSDSNYNYTYTWHWVTTPDGEYDASIQEETGDAYSTFLRLKSNLMSGTLSDKEELDQLRMLIHIVGDLHQPLHVGQPGDRGGNDVLITFTGRSSNLHRLWDSELIESKKMSYTEIAAGLCKRIQPTLIDSLNAKTPADWLREAAALRTHIYDIPEDHRVSYEYIYKYYHIVEERLIAAGIRLAAVLEEIYG